MAGGAQAKMSTWVSKPNQSLISKVTKKRVGFNLKIFVFALRPAMDSFQDELTCQILTNQSIKIERRA